MNMNRTNTPASIYVRENENLGIRLMTREDTDLIVSWRNNERVRSNFIYKETFTRQIHENWIKTKIETGMVVQFVICEKKQGARPVGSVYFRDIDKELKTCEYGIFIGEDDAIGQGYGNQTAVMALSYAFEEMGMETVILRVFCDNTAAVRSYEHAGFVVKEFLEAVECSDGTHRDMLLMQATKASAQ